MKEHHIIASHRHLSIASYANRGLQHTGSSPHVYASVRFILFYLPTLFPSATIVSHDMYHDIVPCTHVLDPALVRSAAH